MTKLKKKLFVRFYSFREMKVGDDSFLVDDVDGAIHFADQVSAALWRFLESPKSYDECVSVFRSALPEHGEAEIEKRIGAALKTLSKKNLIFALSAT